MYNSSLFIRDLSVFLFQEAPILWFTHTIAAVLPLLWLTALCLKMKAFFRPVDHMIYGDTNVVKVSSQEPSLHCLKITQNVAFEFLNFGIFHQFLTNYN